MADMYTYAVARVKVREMNLLTSADIRQLVSAKSYDDAIRMLSDKGFDGGGSFSSYDGLLSGEQKKLWDFISELTDDLSVFDVFRTEKDFHNVKAAIKAHFSGSAPENIYLNGGTVDVEKITNAVKNRDFSVLPGVLSVPSEDAVSILNKTGDGQKCDIVMDKAMINAKISAAEKTGNEFLVGYAKLFADISALKVAVRCCETGKDREFTEFALPECSFDKAEIVAAVASGREAFLEFLNKTQFSDAAEYAVDSYSAFEKWCDNRIMDFIKDQKSNYFTIAPVAAYILARENEIRVVRIILSAKINGFPEGAVMERLRDMYV